MLADQIPYYNVRHYVRPGITGWAQVKYPYGASVSDAYEKLQYDLYYAKHMSLSLDTLIMLKTLKVVLAGNGR
jgi:lipopolysaccharide/colanic/teichoic acid biosynthesis glycosyltransferase